MKNQKPKSKLKYVFMLLNLLAFVNFTQAQVAINNDDSNAAASAALDIKSTTQGVLFPVMTDADRLALKSPATGLIIFNRSGGYFNYYNGTNWVQITRATVVAATNPVGAGTDVGVGVGVADPDNSAILHVNSITKGFLLPRNTTAIASPTAGILYYKTTATSNNIFLYNGTSWDQVNTTALGAAAAGAETPAGLLIGTGTITASAKMEVSSTTGGLLLPRLTDAQRDLIPSPAEGLLIYNTTENKIQYYSGATWFRWSSGTTNYGQVSSNPGTSCKDIYNNNPATVNVNGTYFINPTGTTFSCTCEMTTDGGGWTLVTNTGAKSVANSGTAASGVMPISTSNALAAYTKLSDADINAIRGGVAGYATSIFWLNKQNSASATKNQYFAQNVAYNNAATGSTAIKTYWATYATAATFVGGSAQAYFNAGANGAFDCWNCPSPYQMMSNYSTSGFINSADGGGSPARDLACVLVWVK